MYMYEKIVEKNWKAFFLFHYWWIGGCVYVCTTRTVKLTVTIFETSQINVHILYVCAYEE